MKTHRAETKDANPQPTPGGDSALTGPAADAARRWRKSTRSGFIVAPFEVKDRDEKARTFQGALSTSHLDLGNGAWRDIVWPGAFKRWAKTLKAGAYAPLLDSHNRWSVMNVYGHMLDAEERLTGQTLSYELEGGKTLEVPEMFLDTSYQVIDGPDGDRLFDRLNPGSVRKMSMGYEPIRFDFATLADGSRVRNLRELKVEEGSLVVFAMQPNAEIDAETLKALQMAPLLPEQRAALVAYAPELDALLAPPIAGPPAKVDLPAPATEGLAPEDPRRVEMAAVLRGLTLSSLGGGC